MGDMADMLELGWCGNFDTDQTKCTKCGRWWTDEQISNNNDACGKCGHEMKEEDDAAE